jgi:hypothetical protein
MRDDHGARHAIRTTGRSRPARIEARQRALQWHADCCVRQRNRVLMRGSCPRCRDSAIGTRRPLEKTTMSGITLKRLALVIAGAFALGACTGDATRSDVAYEDETRPAPAAEPAPRTAPRTTAAPAPKRAPSDASAPADSSLPPPAPVADDELVGVESCDDYLETYRSCHRVIAMYPPDSIEERFQTLRARLVENARDPAKHDGLALQCESLARDMETALDGRDCPDEPEIDESVAVDTTLEDAIEDRD